MSPSVSVQEVVDWLDNAWVERLHSLSLDDVVWCLARFSAVLLPHAAIDLSPLLQLVEHSTFVSSFALLHSPLKLPERLGVLQQTLRLVPLLARHFLTLSNSAQRFAANACSQAYQSSSTHKMEWCGKKDKSDKDRNDKDRNGKHRNDSSFNNSSFRAPFSFASPHAIGTTGAIAHSSTPDSSGAHTVLLDGALVRKTFAGIAHVFAGAVVLRSADATWQLADDVCGVCLEALDSMRACMTAHLEGGCAHHWHSALYAHVDLCTADVIHVLQMTGVMADSLMVYGERHERQEMPPIVYGVRPIVCSQSIPLPIPSSQSEHANREKMIGVQHNVTDELRRLQHAMHGVAQWLVLLLARRQPPVLVRMPSHSNSRSSPPPASLHSSPHTHTKDTRRENNGSHFESTLPLQHAHEEELLADASIEGSGCVVTGMLKTERVKTTPPTQVHTLQPCETAHQVTPLTMHESVLGVPSLYLLFCCLLLSPLRLNLCRGHTCDTVFLFLYQPCSWVLGVRQLRRNSRFARVVARRNWKIKIRRKIQPGLVVARGPSPPRAACQHPRATFLHATFLFHSSKCYCFICRQAKMLCSLNDGGACDAVFLVLLCFWAYV